MNSYAAWARVIYILWTAFTHTPAILSYCQATINYLTFHWSCLHGSGSVELSSPSGCQLHRLLHLCRRNLNTIFVCLCLIRDVSQMCPRVALGSSPCCRCGCFLCPVCPWHWQEAAGVIHVTQWCVQHRGDIPHPFWEALTLNTKGWDRLSSAAPTSHCNRTDIDPETCSLQSILSHYFVWVCVCWSKKKKSVGRSDFILEGLDIFIFHPCRLDCRCDKWCDGQKLWKNRKWVRQMLNLLLK